MQRSARVPAKLRSRAASCSDADAAATLSAQKTPRRTILHWYQHFHERFGWQARNPQLHATECRVAPILPPLPSRDGSCRRTFWSAGRPFFFTSRLVGHQPGSCGLGRTCGETKGGASGARMVCASVPLPTTRPVNQERRGHGAPPLPPGPRLTTQFMQTDIKGDKNIPGKRGCGWPGSGPLLRCCCEGQLTVPGPFKLRFVSISDRTAHLRHFSEGAPDALHGVQAAIISLFWAGARSRLPAVAGARASTPPRPGRAWAHAVSDAA